jgi:hypothetical protein
MGVTQEEIVSPAHAGMDSFLVPFRCGFYRQEVLFV